MSELTVVKEFTSKITLSERDQKILRLVDELLSRLTGCHDAAMALVLRSGRPTVQ